MGECEYVKDDLISHSHLVTLLMNIQDEFISTVSHEMRTPLTSIRGFSQTLLSSWDRIDDDSKKKFIKIIEDQSNRLINLVENILTVSKTNAGIVVYKKVEVNSVIEKVVTLLSQQYKDRKIVFLKNSESLFSRLDEDKLQQILTNLIDNACKYSPSGATVKVLSELSEDDVLIKIRDEGVGIKEEDFDKLFKKFSRLENHLTSTTQGNGLGLYITKQLVETLGGKITFESEFGKGTTFKITFQSYNEEEALKCSQKS